MRILRNILTAFSLLVVPSVMAESYSGPLIHPNADGACEWNRNAKWFMYAPSFGFTNVPGVAKYHFKVRGENGADFDFESAKPVVSLVDCWDRIPVGCVTVSCESGKRKFWKAAPFREGTYPSRARSYREAAKGVYDYIFNMKETKYLVQHGKPDASYELNTYISKMFAALIKGMIRSAELEPSRRAEALDVARKAADHLIRKSEPADAPLAYFPPTYDGRGEKDNGYVAEKFQGQIMLIYPAQVSSAFVKLSKVLGDKRYLEAAERIASTYLKLQGEDGTWYLKMYAKDGKPVTPNRLIPIENAVPMFEELYAETGKDEYRVAADRAFKSVEGRLDDWNWEGQFEDVNPTKKYENLTKHPACSTAIYLGQRYPGDAKRRAQMREIMRFTEDQFVCWENPFRGHHVSVWGGTYDDWICPAALEQYNCYYPIDASAAKIIRAYLALYQSEGDRTYLAKAKALGDTATRLQCPDGRLPTWWWPRRAKLVYADWINCMIASAIALEQLADAEEKAKDPEGTFTGAKWIRQEQSAQPDWPTDGVSWITIPSYGATRKFVLDSVPVKATLAAAGFKRLKITVNGEAAMEDVGEWFNPNYLKFADVASLLKQGENVIEVRTPDRAPGCDLARSSESCATDGTHGVFVLTLDIGDKRIVSDDQWPGAKVYSSAKEIPYGRRFSFRREARSAAFRKTFSAAETPRKAVLKITAPGFYEASLNGERVGDCVLDPSPTDFTKRVYYSSYDVTKMIRPGTNDLSVLLGHGWFDCASDPTWNFDRAPWRDSPRMIARLELEYADGRKESVVSDSSWEEIANPVTYDNFRIGERVDRSSESCATDGGAVVDRSSESCATDGGAVKERPSVGQTSGLPKAVETEGPAGVLEPELHHPTKIVRELKPVSVEKLANGDWRVAFGENFTGWMRTRIHNQKPGSVVSFVYDENLDLPRALEMFEKNLGKLSYAARGGKEEFFEPRFTYYGFRYVTIHGLTEAPKADDFTGCFVRTSFPKTGRFKCSDNDFNALMHAAERSYESNFTVGFPTDCPHREKNGWTADAAMAVEFGLTSYDTAIDYRKWLRDIVDAQTPSGMIPAIVPTCGWGSFIFDGKGYGPIWDSALYAVAYGLFRHRGDLDAVRLAFGAMVKHRRFAETQLDGDGLVGKFYGDHCAYLDRQPDNRYCCTVYHLFNTERLAEMAEALGEKTVAAECRASAGRLRAAIVRNFYRGNGVWDDGRETAQALAVDFGLAPESERRATEAQLVKAVKAEKGHFSFGIVGSRHLLRALSKIGRTDLAFAGMVKKSEPSPLLWLKDGGGTLWETWDGKASRNHVMFGDFAAWAYERLAGIRIGERAARRSAPRTETVGRSVGQTSGLPVILAPEPIDALTHVEASVKLPQGTVVASWRRAGDGPVAYTFEVPEGMTAEVRLPGKTPQLVGRRRHEFVDGFTVKAGEVKTVDFGPDGVGGYPCVDFAVARGARVRLSYATHPDGLGEKGDFHHETKANYMGDALWLPILPASTDRFDVFDAEGNGSWRAPLAQGLVRYVRVAVERGSAEITGLRFVNDGIHSEEPVVGSFECSDRRVNDAWKASVRTCQLAAIPARTKPLAVRGVHTNAVLGTTYAYLSDGAKRDRLVWSGDLWWAQRNMYVAFAPDSPFMPGSIRMLAENHTPDGYVQACPFPESHGPLKDGEYGPFASDEFAAWFIPVVWDHVLHIGDRGLAREVYPQVRGLVAYLVRHTGPDGIFEQRLETCKHSCGLAVGGTSMHHRSYMNVLNAVAYRDAAKLAAWLGEEADGKEWAKLAERTAAATRKAFWDDARGHFRLSLEEPVFAFEVNALALASGFATASEASRVLPQLKRNGHGKFQLLAVRGAFAYGFPEKAMELVEAHNWFRYFDPDWKGLRTVYECCGMWTKGWGDEAHPDACIAGVFSNYLLGVEPVEPGYRVFRVRPRPTKTVTSATGSVPTPFGPIHVSWRLENGKVVAEVSAPEGCREWREGK